MHTAKEKIMTDELEKKDPYEIKQGILNEYRKKLKKLSNQQLIMLALGEILSYHEARRLPMIETLSEELNIRSKYD